MLSETGGAKAESRSVRYLSLAIWGATALLLVLIPLKILGMGYLPTDDALRHVAKVISGKSWSEIAVVRDGFGSDEHPGWHAILGALHNGLAWDTDSLMTFSMLVPCVVLWLALLFGRRRPEALLLTMFGASVSACGTLVMRPMLGRPFVVMMVVYVIVLQLWTRGEKVSKTTAALTTGLLGISVWVHGSWYLYGMVPLAFALSGQWGKSVRFTACWAAGVLLGATLTGHPMSYLCQTTVHLMNTLGGHPLPRMLTTELQPSDCDPLFIALIGMMLIWRVARGDWNSRAVRNPLFVLAALGWLLGLQVGRFWSDWGFPAALLWLAQEFDEVLAARLPAGQYPAVLVAGFAAIGLFFATTRDIGSRWTDNLRTTYITPETPDIAGWLPEPGGLVYSYQLEVFFRSFYKNPHADWRYVLAFEPGIMPSDDLAIMRNILWNNVAGSFQPWVKKMRPIDRMILLQESQPVIGGLEWHHAAGDTWIGRLPRPKASAIIQLQSTSDPTVLPPRSGN